MNSGKHSSKLEKAVKEIAPDKADVIVEKYQTVMQDIDQKLLEGDEDASLAQSNLSQLSQEIVDSTLVSDSQYEGRREFLVNVLEAELDSVSEALTLSDELPEEITDYSQFTPALNNWMTPEEMILSAEDLFASVEDLNNSVLRKEFLASLVNILQTVVGSTPSDNPNLPQDYIFYDRLIAVVEKTAESEASISNDLFELLAINTQTSVVLSQLHGLRANAEATLYFPIGHYIFKKIPPFGIKLQVGKINAFDLKSGKVKIGNKWVEYTEFDDVSMYQYVTSDSETGDGSFQKLSMASSSIRSHLGEAKKQLEEANLDLTKFQSLDLNKLHPIVKKHIPKRSILLKYIEKGWVSLDEKGGVTINCSAEDSPQVTKALMDQTSIEMLYGYKKDYDSLDPNETAEDKFHEVKGVYIEAQIAEKTGDVFKARSLYLTFVKLLDSIEGCDKNTGMVLAKATAIESLRGFSLGVINRLQTNAQQMFGPIPEYRDFLNVLLAKITKARHEVLNGDGYLLNVDSLKLDFPEGNQPTGSILYEKAAAYAKKKSGGYDPNEITPGFDPIPNIKNSIDHLFKTLEFEGLAYRLLTKEQITQLKPMFDSIADGERWEDEYFIQNFKQIAPYYPEERVLRLVLVIDGIYERQREYIHGTISANNSTPDERRASESLKVMIENKREKYFSHMIDYFDEHHPLKGETQVWNKLVDFESLDNYEKLSDSAKRKTAFLEMAELLYKSPGASYLRRTYGEGYKEKITDIEDEGYTQHPEAAVKYLEYALEDEMGEMEFQMMEKKKELKEKMTLSKKKIFLEKAKDAIEERLDDSKLKKVLSEELGKSLTTKQFELIVEEMKSEKYLDKMAESLLDAALNQKVRKMILEKFQENENLSGTALLAFDRIVEIEDPFDEWFNVSTRGGLSMVPLIEELLITAALFAVSGGIANLVVQGARLGAVAAFGARSLRIAKIAQQGTLAFKGFDLVGMSLTFPLALKGVRMATMGDEWYDSFGEYAEDAKHAGIMFGSIAVGGFVWDLGSKYLLARMFADPKTSATFKAINTVGSFSTEVGVFTGLGIADEVYVNGKDLSDINKTQMVGQNIAMLLALRGAHTFMSPVTGRLQRKTEMLATRQAENKQPSIFLANKGLKPDFFAELSGSSSKEGKVKAMEVYREFALRHSLPESALAGKTGAKAKELMGKLDGISYGRHKGVVTEITGKTFVELAKTDPELFALTAMKGKFKELPVTLEQVDEIAKINPNLLTQCAYKLPKGAKEVYSLRFKDFSIEFNGGTKVMKPKTVEGIVHALTRFSKHKIECSKSPEGIVISVNGYSITLKVDPALRTEFGKYLAKTFPKDFVKPTPRRRFKRQTREKLHYPTAQEKALLADPAYVKPRLLEFFRKAGKKIVTGIVGVLAFSTLSIAALTFNPGNALASRPVNVKPGITSIYKDPRAPSTTKLKADYGEEGGKLMEEYMDKNAPLNNGPYERADIYSGRPATRYSIVKLSPGKPNIVKDVKNPEVSSQIDAVFGGPQKSHNNLAWRSVDTSKSVFSFEDFDSTLHNPIGASTLEIHQGRTPAVVARERIGDLAKVFGSKGVDSNLSFFMKSVLVVQESLPPELLAYSRVVMATSPESGAAETYLFLANEAMEKDHEGSYDRVLDSLRAANVLRYDWGTFKGAIFEGLRTIHWLEGLKTKEIPHKIGEKIDVDPESSENIALILIVCLGLLTVPAGAWVRIRRGGVDAQNVQNQLNKMLIALGESFHEPFGSTTVDSNSKNPKAKVEELNTSFASLFKGIDLAQFGERIRTEANILGESITKAKEALIEAKDAITESKTSVAKAKEKLDNSAPSERTANETAHKAEVSELRVRKANAEFLEMEISEMEVLHELFKTHIKKGAPELVSKMVELALSVENPYSESQPKMKRWNELALALGKSDFGNLKLRQFDRISSKKLGPILKKHEKPLTRLSTAREDWERFIKQNISENPYFVFNVLRQKIELSRLEERKRVLEKKKSDLEEVKDSAENYERDLQELVLKIEAVDKKIETTEASVKAHTAEERVISTSLEENLSEFKTALEDVVKKCGGDFDYLLRGGNRFMANIWYSRLNPLTREAAPSWGFALTNNALLYSLGVGLSVIPSVIFNVMNDRYTQEEVQVPSPYDDAFGDDKPSSKKEKPGEEKPKPDEEKPKPVEEKPKPVEDKPKPVEDKPKPEIAPPTPQEMKEDKKALERLYGGGGDRAATPGSAPTQDKLPDDEAETIGW